MTDGYGDYVRHYLRAMAWNPELAPSGQIHLLQSTSIVQHAEYQPEINKFYNGPVPAEKVKDALVVYRTFDQKSTEILRMEEKPESVWVNDKLIEETEQSEREGWTWRPSKTGGVLTINHSSGNEIIVYKNR
jgi:hypothetical protein